VRNRRAPVNPQSASTRKRISARNATAMRVPLINLGHALDHIVMLIYPTVVLTLMVEFQQSYAELIALLLGGFIAFGAGSLPAGWLADRWNRDRMMVIFFIGTGLACFTAAAASTPMQMAAALTAIGVFASIYHPVAAPLLVASGERIGRTLGTNGFFGNFGVAVAALLAGALTDLMSWRAAFAVPGVACVVAGIAYIALVPPLPCKPRTAQRLEFGFGRGTTRRLLIAFFTTALIAGLIFASTTVLMPKLFAERLTGAGSATAIGGFVFTVFFCAGLAQMIVGPLIDRYSVRPVLLAVIAAQAPFLFLSGEAEGPALILISAIMMFAVFGQIPVNDVIIGRYVPDAYRARAYALRYLVSFTAGMLAVPFIAYGHEAGGFTWIFTALSLSAGIMLIAALFLPGEAALRPAATADQAKVLPAE
jgi:MFS family permease